MLLDIYGLTRQVHSIPVFHPMLKYLPKKETQVTPFYISLLRPVPSGGALFPCELYLLVANRDKHGGPYSGQEQCLSAGIYHYDAVHHALDILEQGDYSSLLQSALAHPADPSPTYTLLLSSFFWKDGFKYGAFSYRLQGLDIGTVISQSEIITRHAGLSTTIHYQFQDKALNDLLGLDPLQESVYAVIEWRQGENEAGEGARKTGAGLAPAFGPDHAPSFGTINASVLGNNEASSGPMTESIARWPLPEEVHRASLIETREAFRPLRSLAPVQPLHSAGGETLPLSTDAPLDLWEARSKRRSATGTFLPTPLTKQQLSQLLRTSMHGTANDLDGHTDFLQHTLLYCIVFRVQGIPAGIYRYQPERHALEPVRAGVFPYELYQVLSVPNFDLFYMSVSLFPVGNYTSGFQIYGDRWYRMQNMEAGIIAQRLYLAAAALKLGCRASLGFEVPETNRFLELSNAEDDQYTGLMQVMIAPERPAYQYYEQSLLI
jgi:SagB-type dehydrogenase family enzyme